MNKNINILVLGGYVNGYSIIKELHEKGVRNIVLFDYVRSIGSVSNKIKSFVRIEKKSESLKKAILDLKKRCDYIIIYPTDDLQIEFLHEIYNEIINFCFIPFNKKTIIPSLDKYTQYHFCEKYNIPYPKTKNINEVGEIYLIAKMLFPVLVKPAKRYDSSMGVFRSMFIKGVDDLNNKRNKLTSLLNKEVSLIVSEFIPGDDTNIYAYVGYRSKEGKVLNEWIGKKLTQYPDRFGVFSSAINTAPEIIKRQGEKLLNVMDLHGICEPEFKYDERDGKYKLMEINLRSMMWHRLGNLSGVHLQYTQYLDALGKEVKKEKQNLKGDIHFVYMKHEISNIIFRKKYWKHFKNNVFKGKKRYFAIYDKTDIKPFLYDLIGLIRALLGRCRRMLKIE
ncbi:carboxylate--amine ligase [Tenacibaculum maritimum]|uniref:carboxylate--amine ligase n=1 Tax=Tenacibaculum maritimum TaxID=107401 RepID=UPI003877644E